MREECEKYGTVLEMKVPRPTGGARQAAGVGKIFVKFDTLESAGKALRALAGRKFADRTVVTTYFSEVSFNPIRIKCVETKYVLMRYLHHRIISRSMRGDTWASPRFL